MKSFLEKTKCINNTIGYILFALVVLNILILPFVFLFIEFLPEWKENHLLILLFNFTFLLLGISSFILVFVTLKEFNKKLEEKYKSGKIKNWSDKKIKIFSLFIFVFVFFMSINFIVGESSYVKKSMVYIYFQDEKPIAFIKTVNNASSGGSIGKFIQYVYFGDSKDRYTHMFSGKRFQVGQKYEIKIIPDTKSILESRLLPEE